LFVLDAMAKSDATVLCFEKRLVTQRHSLKSRPAWEEGEKKMSSLTASTVRIQACFKTDKRDLDVPCQWSVAQLRLHLIDAFGLASNAKLMGLLASVRVMGDLIDAKKTPRVVLIGSTQQEVAKIVQADAALVQQHQPSISAPSAATTFLWTRAHDTQQALAEPLHVALAHANDKVLSDYRSSRRMYGGYIPSSAPNQACRALAAGKISTLRHLVSNTAIDATFTGWMQSMAPQLACRVNSTEALRLVAEEHRVALQADAIVEYGYVWVDTEWGRGQQAVEMTAEMPIDTTLAHISKTLVVLAVALGHLSVVRYLVDECDQEAMQLYVRNNLRTWLLPMSIAAVCPEVCEFLLAKMTREQGKGFSPDEWHRCAALAACLGDACAFLKLHPYLPACDDEKDPGFAQTALVVRALEHAIAHRRFAFLQLIWPELGLSPRVWFKSFLGATVKQAWWDGLVWLRTQLPNALFPWEAASDLYDAPDTQLSPAEADAVIVSLLDMCATTTHQQDADRALDTLLATGLRPSDAWCQQMRTWVQPDDALTPYPKIDTAILRPIIRFQASFEGKGGGGKLTLRASCFPSCNSCV
jgi:hypothetical protein